MLALAAWCLSATLIDAFYWRWGHALFTALNSAFLIYAITQFVGWRASFVDLGLMKEHHPAEEPAQLAEAPVVPLPQQRPDERQVAAAVSMYSYSVSHAEPSCISQGGMKLTDR